MMFNTIKSKLLAGGTALIILPMIITGYLSYSKSYSAFLNQSMQTAEGTARDLAETTNKAISGDVYLASAMASQKLIVDIAAAVNEKGADAVSDDIAIVFNDLKNQFGKLDNHYQGIFIAGTDGILFTGILDSGKEYKGSNISKRAYFNEARQTGKTVVSEVVKSKSTGKLIVVACAPIFSKDKRFVGALGLVIRAEFFIDLVATRKIGETGYGYMINNKGIIIAHPNREHLLTLDVTSIESMKEINTKMINGNAGVERYTFKGVDKIAGFAPVAFNGWSICATQNEEEFLQATNQIRNYSIVFIIIAGTLGLFLIFLMARSILIPLQAAIDGLTDISQGDGDLTKRLAVKTGDEVGELSNAFNAFIDQLQGMIREITEGMVTLTASSTELSAISSEMSASSGSTSEKSSSVAAASEEMSTNMNSVSAAMEESTANTHMVVSAVEEMNATITEIAKNTENARGITDSAVSKTAGASKQVNELGAAASKISKVVDTITDISEQVNLLALNATIEAARAGEAGKGFAVVANEIKDLANQTADASNEIKAQITGIQSSTDGTVEQISEISDVVTEINDIVSTIATAVEEQSATTQEISQNMNQASLGIQEVNENVSQCSTVASEISKDITDVNQSSGDMADKSEQVKTSAEELSKLSEQLNRLVGKFII